jgi:hypothetical protein
LRIVIQQKNILVAPLDWGLGHATRCVPIIRRLIADGHRVQLASNGRSARWLADYFPQLPMHTEIPDYAITYPKRGSMPWHFVKESPRLLRVIQAEQRWLKRFVEAHAIDEVYSDNRYGLHHKRVKCTIITHQLFIRAPWYARAALHRLTFSYINKFSQCLIPDYAGEKNLSGALSHGALLPPNAEFIGPQSRFAGMHVEPSSMGYDVVALISGPEPTRSQFQQELIERLHAEKKSALVICGTPEQHHDTTEGKVRILSHLTDSEMATALKFSHHIICRPGYSTIMDLHALGCRAEFVPTPGQTEQEYLSEALSADFKIPAAQNFFQSRKRQTIR